MTVKARIVKLTDYETGKKMLVNPLSVAFVKADREFVGEVNEEWVGEVKFTTIGFGDRKEERVRESVGSVEKLMNAAGVKTAALRKG